jgi:hypothetical protein
MNHKRLVCITLGVASLFFSLALILDEWRTSILISRLGTFKNEACIIRNGLFTAGCDDVRQCLVHDFDCGDVHVGSIGIRAAVFTFLLVGLSIQVLFTVFDSSSRTGAVLTQGAMICAALAWVLACVVFASAPGMQNPQRLSQPFLSEFGVSWVLVLVFGVASFLLHAAVLLVAGAAPVCASGGGLQAGAALVRSATLYIFHYCVCKIYY